MAKYELPKTPAERLTDFNKLVGEFNEEYNSFTDKAKKVSAHRARKALLSISKLARFIRKDIQDAIIVASKKDK